MTKGLSGVPLESMFDLSINKNLRGHEFKLAKHKAKLGVRRLFTVDLSTDGVVWISMQSMQLR